MLLCRFMSQLSPLVSFLRFRRQQRQVACLCAVHTSVKTSASVFLNLLFILLTFSLYTEAGQTAPEAQTLKCTLSLVDSTANCNMNPQKGPVFYNGLKKSPFSSHPDSPQLFILQNKLNAVSPGTPPTLALEISDKNILCPPGLYTVDIQHLSNC